VSVRAMRWIRRLLICVIVLIVVVFVFLETGLPEKWLRNEFVSRLERGTGARVDIGGFHFHIWRLRLELDDLTVHGSEASDRPPLFHADRVDVAFRIISFFSRQIALDELIVEHPEAAVRIDANGRNNLPTPRNPGSNRPWRQTLFDLRVGNLELRDGEMAYNDRREPLNIDGKNLNFTLHYDAPAVGADSYVGNLGWQQVRLAAQRDVPFRFDVSAKFLLHRDSFELNELVLKALHSSLNLSAELPSFARSEWNLKYQGRLSLADIRNIFRAPTTPDGNADFSGQAHFAAGLTTSAAGGGVWTARGHYSSRDIRMPYQFFHDSGMETSGDFEVANRRLVVPDVNVRALGGTVNGRLEMDFKGLAFRTQTQLRGVSLADLFDALDNKDMPVKSLHWDGVVDVDSVNTWNLNFKNFRTVGEMRWSPPATTLQPGQIPATARLGFDYHSDNQTVAISDSEIAIPTSHIDVDGFIGQKESALEVMFRTDDLVVWDDFISAIRGPDAGTHHVGGKATWRGRIIGPLTEVSFAGHLSLTNPQYDTVAWDQLDGDMEYSPDGFLLKNTSARRGDASATLNLSLQFNGDWSFLPSEKWTLDAHVTHATGADVQGILGTSYPVTGQQLSGDIQGSGTRAEPILDASFVVDDVGAMGAHFDRLSGELHWRHDELRLSHAQLRGYSAMVAGDVRYLPDEQQAEFNITGTGIALEKIRKLQSPSLPVQGQLDFSAKGSGPLRALTAQADLRVTNLRLGTESEGDFSGQLNSDGKIARITLASEPSHEKLQGELDIGLTGDELVSGKLSLVQFDLDPFIVAGLHMAQLTGHGSGDGTFTFSGSLRHPETIEVDADIARISFNYDFVQLTNDQNIRLAYRRNEIRIEQARLHGPDTDMRLTGSGRFDRDRRIDFTLTGGVNLRLLAGVIPDLNAKGRANVNVSVQGTMSQPRLTGRATVRDASAIYADFPVGLSKVNGDLVFDKSRLLFDKITAEAGGGQLALSGNIAYGEGPMRYQIAATTTVARVRYPTGMSWLVGGTIQLSGTRDAALISGHVQVQRLLFAQGVDVASFFASSSDTTPGAPSASTFMQNLTFDVEGQTTPGARIEWAGAHIEVDGNVRLRGTWDRPVILGHIHLLGGEMPFRGNTFELTRGDINFSNPFRLDPVLNVEATSTISQYQVTIDFSGPSSHLALNYRSDPPLPDSDIVALLALGSPGEESGLRSQPGGAQNYGATALLSEAISSGIGGRIEHLFGISSFRVDPFVAGTATESNAAARVTIQEQVTRDLSITYSTNAATSNQYQLIQVEYTVKKGLSVVFLRDINGTYGLDVKWVKHFN
jgi:translocation and assembly module TamB